MSLDYVNNVPVIIEHLRKANHPGNKIRREFLEHEDELLATRIRNGKILVAGSGLGDDSFKIAKYNREVVGVEFLPELIAISTKEAKRRAIKNVRFAQADFTKPHFVEDRFDAAVLNMGTIGNFNDKSPVIESLLSVADVVYLDIYKVDENALKKRKQMYEEEGWVDVKIDGKTIFSDDGLESEAISKEEIEEICNSLDAEVKFYDFSDIAIMAEIKKRI